MLEAIGVESVDELFERSPPTSASTAPSTCPTASPRPSASTTWRRLPRATPTRTRRSASSAPACTTTTCPAIVDAITQRSEFLTPYTPYQPEVSQGGLQAMFEFQTAISELTGLPVSNASLYEGPSSVASAAYLALGRDQGLASSVVSRGLHPHSRADARTYARGLRRRGGRGRPRGRASPTPPSSPTRSTTRPPPSSSRTRTSSAAIEDLEALAAAAKDAGALAVAAVDPITLGVLRPPGECGVDVARRRGPAARQPARLRRAVVRVLRRDRGAPAPDAGPDRRRDHRRRRPPRLRARAADARAAHPPREGDPQHLHLAGAERARRRDLPELARQARAGRAGRAARPAGPPTRASG